MPTLNNGSGNGHVLSHLLLSLGDGAEVARKPHKLEVVGSIPTHPTNFLLVLSYFGLVVELVDTRDFDQHLLGVKI